jgi:predicted enzyme related to lactoylglutathione lyase
VIGRIDEVVIDCSQPKALAAFWSAVLGGQMQERDQTWCYIDPPRWTRLAFQKVPESKIAKNRLHLDVEVSEIPVAISEAEALGAKRVGGVQQDSAGSFQVMLDPEGNEWCLVHAN